MSKHNANNERIKRRYFSYLKEAMRQSEPSVDATAAAIHRFEKYTKYKDFKKFHIQQAIGFKNYLADQKNQQTGKPLSKATLHSTLGHLKKFFFWLAGQPGYKSRLQHSDSDYFNISEKDMRIATARREQKAPTLEQVKHAISQMPVETEIQRRNRALVAFTLLTTARVSAIASMKLKHVDLSEGCLQQDAREVKTKFSKTFTTYFFPVGDEIQEIVVDWVKYLREEKLWGNDDPLFPSTRVAQNTNYQFEAVGLDRKHWSSATPIRKIFKEAFEKAGLPYFNPHCFRNTLTLLGENLCRTPEQFKAWSQNFGHEKVLTTFLSYGQVENRRQGEIIRGLAKPQQPPQTDAIKIAKAVAHELRKSGN